MLKPSDFWRAAKYLIGRYGVDARDRASRRADALRDQGDSSGHDTWHVLATTIFELQSGSDSASDRSTTVSMISIR